jgi:subtilisin family serine protease
VAKGVHLVAVRVLDCDGSGSYSGIIAGIDWVTQHAAHPAVINMSLGGPASSLVNAAVRNAVASGITVAVAAGNSNLDASNVSPASEGTAITVGATDVNDVRASYSNFGPALDIFAPGSGITSDSFASDTSVTTMNGTSMASPHVAGAAALVLADHPTYTPAQVQSALVGGTVQSAAVLSAGAQTTTRLLYTGPATSQAPVTVTQPSTVVAPAPVVQPCNVRTGGGTGIRDRGTATSSVYVSGCGGKASARTRVEVHIVHPRRGDLTIELVGPGGLTKKLKAANKRDRGANVDAVYTVNMSKKLRNGGWKLRISDKYKGTVGYLASWTLTC